jgi:tRNA (guanine-N7-)-methyltransferase
MRQKRIKNVDEKMVLFSEPLVGCPVMFKGRWREAFGGFRASAPLRLEIGCGKGRFIKASALKDPGSLYLGFEGQRSVIYRALQRAYTDPDVRLRDLNEVALALVGLHDGDCADGGSRDSDAAAPPDNLRFCAEYIMDMRDYFTDGELSGVFLNFSDPWPKARQEKRRLTSPGYLRGYRDALASGGFLRFKTDSADFFAYSRARIEEDPGFEITALTEDLHASAYAGDNELTEYELRFLNLNKKIHYFEARKLSRLWEV